MITEKDIIADINDGFDFDLTNIHSCMLLSGLKRTFGMK